MSLTGPWFTEVCEEGGTAFSVRLGEGGRRHMEETPYQTIEIYETTDFGALMVIDGFIMLSGRDNFLYHEMLSHPALFTHPAPTRVAIIGGGDCGTLREVLRHPEVETAWLVEIDERVTRLAEAYFPALTATNDDPRAQFHFGDGLAWINQQPAGSLDVIIVDSTDPIGPAAGLFAAPFYRNCQQALGEHGVLVQQSESPLIHHELIRSMHDNMREGGFTATHTLAFPQPVYPSGWWTATMATNGLTPTEFREQAARAKTFDTVYYNADIHRGALAVPEFMRQHAAR